MLVFTKMNGGSDGLRRNSFLWMFLKQQVLRSSKMGQQEIMA
jgi:hypothetical protein